VYQPTEEAVYQPAEEAVYQPTEQVVEQVADQPAEKAATSADKPFAYFLSFRPEYVEVFDEISTVGLCLEFGLLSRNGLFLTADLSAGINYLGGMANVGYSFDMPALRIIGGVSGGYHRTTLVAKLVTENDRLVGREYGENVGFGGPFLKLTWKDIDITGRVLFGRKSDSPVFDEVEYIVKNSGNTATWSIGIGYNMR
jgi:hypothetical protein